MTRIICGVDVCSSWLEARVGRDGAAASFPNTEEGIAALAAFCRTHTVELVAMEATGGYEQRALAQLSEQGLPVTILNPRAVRQFAERSRRCSWRPAKSKDLRFLLLRPTSMHSGQIYMSIRPKCGFSMKDATRSVPSRLLREYRRRRFLQPRAPRSTAPPRVPWASLSP